MPKIFRYHGKGFTQTDVHLDIKRLFEGFLERLRTGEDIDMKKLRVEINNTLQKAKQPIGNPISDARLRKLRAIAEADLKPYLEVIEEGGMRPLEGVVICLAKALFIMQGYVKGEIKQ